MKEKKEYMILQLAYSIIFQARRCLNFKKFLMIWKRASEKIILVLLRMEIYISFTLFLHTFLQIVIYFTVYHKFSSPKFKVHPSLPFPGTIYIACNIYVWQKDICCNRVTSKLITQADQDTKNTNVFALANHVS